MHTEHMYTPPLYLHTHSSIWIKQAPRALTQKQAVPGTSSCCPLLPETPDNKSYANQKCTSPASHNVPPIPGEQPTPHSKTLSGGVPGDLCWWASPCMAGLRASWEGPIEGVGVCSFCSYLLLWPSAQACADGLVRADGSWNGPGSSIEGCCLSVFLDGSTDKLYYIT